MRLLSGPARGKTCVKLQFNVTWTVADPLMAQTGRGIGPSPQGHRIRLIASWWILARKSGIGGKSRQNQ